MFLSDHKVPKVHKMLYNIEKREKMKWVTFAKGDLRIGDDRRPIIMVCEDKDDGFTCMNCINIWLILEKYMM